MKPKSEPAWVEKIRREAREGCDVREDGTKTDVVFHEKGMNWTPEAEARDLKEMSVEVRASLEQEAEKSETNGDLEHARWVWLRLTLLFPQDPDRAKWQKRLRVLMKK